MFMAMLPPRMHKFQIHRFEQWYFEKHAQVPDRAPIGDLGRKRYEDDHVRDE